MADERHRVLPALARAREFAKLYRFAMTDEYRSLIARVEAMPRNRPGADKSGRWLGSRADRKAFLEGFVPAPRRFLVEGVGVPTARLLHILESKHAAGRPKDHLFLATHNDALEQLLKKPDAD